MWLAKRRTKKSVLAVRLYMGPVRKSVGTGALRDPCSCLCFAWRGPDHNNLSSGGQAGQRKRDLIYPARHTWSQDTRPTLDPRERVCIIVITDHCRSLRFPICSLLTSEEHGGELRVTFLTEGGLQAARFMANLHRRFFFSSFLSIFAV